jgi:hypothetical protein
MLDHWRRGIVMLRRGDDQSMTDVASPPELPEDDLAASLARLEHALGRISEAQAKVQAEGHIAVPEPAPELPANLAVRLDGIIARLRAVVDNREEGAAWPRSV